MYRQESSVAERLLIEDELVLRSGSEIAFDCRLHVLKLPLAAGYRTESCQTRGASTEIDRSDYGANSERLAAVPRTKCALSDR